MDLGPQAAPLPPRPAGLAEAPVSFLFPPAVAVPAPLRPPARDPLALAPDPALAAAYGPARCLADGVLPWAWNRGELLVATESPRHLARARDSLTARFGPFLRPVELPRPQIETAVLSQHGPALARAAETRCPAAQSCRALDPRRLALTFAALAATLLLAALAAPQAMLLAAFALALLALLANTALKIAAALAALHSPPRPEPAPLPDTDLPRISLLIALFRESDIAARLIRRLERLDYPRDRLEVLLLVEDDDTPTRDALVAATLPAWMRVIPVPAGTIRTKPRALNLALDAAQGDIIGVYDAEDAPEPDQLRTVAAAFAAAPAQVACLQAALDFYNPRRNWLSRCFTLEYAQWFRLILPGLERLRLPLPLGGTSVFFRRAPLAALGGWDAHNVTEDADLGIRLARHGLTTRMIPSTTHEEANCRALPWVRQRSRWIKGYLMTWLVHMQSPRRLLRDLGPRGFAGFQILFLGTLAQTLLGPLLLSLWSVPLGFGHPVQALLPAGALLSLGLLLLTVEAVSTLLLLAALRRSGQPVSPLWIPTLHAYFPLGTLAAAKALAEVVTRPFYWDKTCHGQFDDSP